MAEGHLVVRWARRLRSLVGQPLVRVELPTRFAERAPGLVGQHVAEVASNGKHLLVHFSGGDVLHCHAMMFGSWQVGRPGMKLRKPPERVRVRLRTAEREAVFFNGPVAELLTAEELAAHARLNALGPDLLAEEFDRQEAWRRLQADPNREIADAVLDQTIVAGIGNIYKSEGLFLAGIDPRTAAGALPRPVVDRLWRTLIPLMRKGITDRRMRTRPKPKEGEDHHHWVYRRRGLPCFRCGSKILRIVQGKMKRSTYWCPTCQSDEAVAGEDRPATRHTRQRKLPGME